MKGAHRAADGGVVGDQAEAFGEDEDLVSGNFVLEGLRKGKSES